jgi:hypothetical protein
VQRLGLGKGTLRDEERSTLSFAVDSHGGWSSGLWGSQGARPTAPGKVGGLHRSRIEWIASCSAYISQVRLPGSLPGLKNWAAACKGAALLGAPLAGSSRGRALRRPAGSTAAPTLTPTELRVIDRGLVD